MKKKRVAFVVNSLYGGGAEMVLQTVLRHIDRERYDVTLVNHRCERPDERYPDDIEYRCILTDGATFWGRVYNKISLVVWENLPPRAFRVLYFRERFDVEIAFIEGYATRIVAGGHSRRKIAWVHIDMKTDPWSEIAYRSPKEQSECYRRFDKVVCVSKRARDVFEELFETGRSHTIYNPVESDRIRSAARLFSPERDAGVPLLVAVGRLVEQKGYDRLIPIVGRLVGEGFDLRLWIVGEGPQRELLEKLIREWRLEGVVTLLGWKDNPVPYISAADWFVLSSRWEGYGLVMAEAMIVGTPVLAVECAGTKELLGDNRWGIVVENSDEALADKLREILGDGELRAMYRDRAVKRGGQFSLEEQMMDIYNVIEG